MTTKDEILAFNETEQSSAHKDGDNRYSNFNLNQSYKCPIIIPVQSCSKSNNDKYFETAATLKDSDLTVSDNYKEKGNVLSWKKSSTLIFKNEVDKKAKKHWRKDGSLDSNSSTLSLHIEAYENSAEASESDSFDGGNTEDLKNEKSEAIKKHQNNKQVFIASNFIIDNQFEFPRQQNNVKSVPEVSQFKASQQLVNQYGTLASMGSRLRSAAPSAAGALTATEFKHSFDTTPPDNVPNAKALLQRLQDLNNFLADGNKDWSQKAKMLISLRGCLIATHIPRAVDIVMENCGIWERCLIDGLKELRSSLTREYCITIAFFAVKLESRFIRQVELMFNNLMNLVQNSAKIMSSSGVILSEFIARHVHHSKLITLTSGYLVSKSSVVRRSVVHMFDVMLSSWERDILELHMNVIKEVIKSGLNDADLSCRATSRDTYFAFSEKFPSQAQELYDSLDTIRQRALNDQQRSAASSTNSLAHEKDGLHLNSLLKVGGSLATQQAFLANRSRSDAHFRYNGTRPIPRGPPSRSRNTSPTRTNPHSPHSSKMRPAVFAKPTTVTKISAPSAPSARLNNVAPRINTNLRAIPSASSSRPPTNSAPLRMRPNGVPSTPLTGSASLTSTRTNQPTVFGTARNFAMPRSAIKPPTSAIQPPKYARPNVIRTVPTPTFNDQQTNELTSSLTNLKLNSNPLTQSQHASITDSTTSNESSNGNGISPTEHSLKDIIANIGTENVDVKRPEKLIESLKTLTELITMNQLTQQHFDEHFNVLLLYCTQLLRISEASNTLKMAVLDALRVLITAQPKRIADKAELALFRVLDAQDRDDATLTRAAEDCGAAIVAHLDVERCKKILIPLISNDQINPSTIASSLKLLCRKIETLSPEDVDQLFKDTRDVVVKSYEHQESMVRRASILFFVTVSNVIGTEPLRPYLAASIFKLVEVYRNKAQIKPRKGF